MLNCARHINVDPDAQFEATAAMREEVKEGWFWEIVGPMLEGGQPVRTKAVLLQLAKAANASNHTAQLETLIDWLDWVGLVKREGDQMCLRDGNQPTAQPVNVTAGHAVENVAQRSRPRASQPLAEAGQPSDPVDPVPTAVARDEALVSFNLSVRLRAEDVKGLTDEQMSFLMEFAQKLRG